jgi:Ca2+-binding EF-hand superfamily protein
MKISSKIIVLLAGAAVSATAIASAYADDGQRGAMRRDGEGYHHAQKMRGGMGPRGEGPNLMFQRADKDNSGTVTLEEFAAMSPLSFTDADADGDGNINADELAAQLEREMLRRRAERMIERFDADNDGQVSLAELENRRNQMFARMDIDGSGAIEQDELRGMRGQGHGDRGEGRGPGHHRKGGWGRN